VPLDAYDSRELGRKLAESVLEVIDWARAGDADDDDDRSGSGGDGPLLKLNADALPSLGDAPKCAYAQLPDGLHYFHAAKPQLTPIEKPHVLVTNHAGRYCRLVFDQHDCLQAL
jgi:hypothetical protein